MLNQKTSLWICGLLGTLYLFIEIFYKKGILLVLNSQYSHWIHSWISEPDFPSLFYYQGLVYEKAIGPFTSFLAGLILILLFFSFFQKSSSLKFFLFTLSFLVISKWPVLTYPPFGDEIGGPLMEALWLSKHNFNFFELAQQDSYSDGGPKVYLFSIYPYAIALLLKIFRNPTLFLIANHVLIFIMSSMIITLFRNIIAKFTTPKIAGLSSLLLLSIPLYQSMTESINMEIPCLFFAITALYFLIKEKFLFASIFAIGAAAIKMPGILICGVVLAGALLKLFDTNSKDKKFSIIFWPIMACAIAVAKVILRGKFVSVAGVSHNSIEPLIGWANIKAMPYPLGLALFFFICVLINLGRSFFKTKVQNNTPKIQPQFTTLMMLLWNLAWFALYINFSVMGPRYKLLLLPSLIYGVIYCTSLFIRSERFLSTILYVIILISFVSSFGLFYKPVESRYYSYVHTERSLEYRNEMKLHQELAKELETHFSGQTVAAPFVTAQILAFPEWGYVRESLDVMIYEMSLSYEGIKNFTGLKNEDYNSLVWVGFKSNARKNIPYPLTPKDHILKDVTYGDKKATLFRGGYAIDYMFKLMIQKTTKKKILVYLVKTYSITYLGR